MKAPLCPRCYAELERNVADDGLVCDSCAETLTDRYRFMFTGK